MYWLPFLLGLATLAAAEDPPKSPDELADVLLEDLQLRTPLRNDS